MDKWPAPFPQSINFANKSKNKQHNPVHQQHTGLHGPIRVGHSTKGRRSLRAAAERRLLRRDVRVSRDLRAERTRTHSRTHARSRAELHDQEAGSLSTFFPSSFFSSLSSSTFRNCFLQLGFLSPLTRCTKTETHRECSDKRERRTSTSKVRVTKQGAGKMARTSSVSSVFERLMLETDGVPVLKNGWPLRLYSL